MASPDARTPSVGLLTLHAPAELQRERGSGAPVGTVRSRSSGRAARSGGTAMARRDPAVRRWSCARRPPSGARGRKHAYPSVTPSRPPPGRRRARVRRVRRRRRSRRRRPAPADVARGRPSDRPGRHRPAPGVRDGLPLRRSRGRLRRRRHRGGRPCVASPA